MGLGVPDEVAFEAYGVRLVLGASDEHLLPLVAELAPPGAVRVGPAEGDARFTLTAEDGLGYRVGGTDQVELTTIDLDLALGLLAAEVRLHVALHAPGLVFVNAGAVARDGRAIVLPGPSLSGTTTLVKALVAAGAVYYSDTYAVVDEDGLVHPFPRPLDNRRVDAVGGPVPVGIVALAPYRPGAHWEPELRTEAPGVMALLGHAVRVREQPETTLRAARRAVTGAMVLAGERGEASETAAALLDALADGLPRVAGAKELG